MNILPLIQDLQPIFGDRITTNDHDLQQHGKDESSRRPMPPDAVCYPITTDEVSAAVNACRKYQIPIVPFGAGSSLEGHVFALRGGLTIDLTRMDKILRVSEGDLDCTVQAGVTRQQLNEHLKTKGLFFPVDPGADATLGGMASTRASGTNAVRYGTMRENVLSLKVVLPSGEVIETGTRARKSASGYDLTRLFVGSEGTLGVVTEVTLRLYGLPEAISAATVSFTNFESAVEAVSLVMQVGVPMARIEFLDEVMVDAVNRFSGLTLVAQPTLFLEFHGSPNAVKENTEKVGEIMHECGGSDFKWATSTEERNALWKARHNSYFAGLAYKPGCRVMSTDVCVPVSRLAECILATKSDLRSSFLPAPMVGHVGDGNFHLLLLVDPNKPEDCDEAYRINDRLVKRALAMNGTISGEHGVGVGKLKYMEAEHGAAALDVMRTIKHALDPDNLMNPGKLLPE